MNNSLSLAIQGRVQHGTNLNPPINWAEQPEVLFYGLYSEISGGQMPNKVTGATDYLTVAGSVGSETYQCPNTAPYIAADTDYIWFKTDETQRTTTTAELIGYDLQRTPVKYDDETPYALREILILKSGETISGTKLDRLFSDFWLSIWWNGLLNENGHTKGNRLLAQNLWTPEELIAYDNYWKLDGNSLDSGTRGDNGTDTAITYSLANGVVNEGAGFNGTTSKIIKDNFVNTSQEGTISLFFKLNAATTYCGLCGIGGKNTGTTYGGLLNFQIRDVGGSMYLAVIHVNRLDPGIFNVYRGTTPITANTWHHAVITSNGSIWELWLDGVKQTLTPLSFNVGTNSGQWFGDVTIPEGLVFIIGAAFYQNAYGGFTNGAIDEVKVSNTKWTDQQIIDEAAKI